MPFRLVGNVLAISSCRCSNDVVAVVDDDAGVESGRTKYRDRNCISAFDNPISKDSSFK